MFSGVGSSPLISTVSGDFLDLSLESTDQINVTVLSVKKNDDTGDIPGVPENIITSNHSDTTVTISYEPPLTGGLPVTYDVEYSLSPAETGGVPDSHIVDPSTKNLSDLSVVVSGLSPGTAYYFWVRAKNNSGESVYVGPIQTNTDGSYNAGDVGFTLVILDFNTIRASWTQPVGKQLRFTLIRDLDTPLETVVDDDTPASGASNSYDDDLLDSNTLHNYIFQVRNEFGTLISIILASATTDPLPSPSTVLSLSGGVRLQFAVTFPAQITLAKIEYATDAGFTNPVPIDFARPLGDWSIQSVENFITNGLVKSTQYFGRVKFVKNGVAGSFGNTTPTDVTTSNVNPPAKPGIVMSSPATGQVRIKLDFNDGSSTGEWIVVSYRLQASVGPYTAFETYFRDDPPLDDLDVDEDEIEIIRSGFTPGESLTFRAEAFNQSGASLGGADTDNVLVDP
jgi:hypothetical protein